MGLCGAAALQEIDDLGRFNAERLKEEENFEKS